MCAVLQWELTVMAQKQANTAPIIASVAPAAAKPAIITSTAMSPKTPAKSTTTRHANAPVAKKNPVAVTTPEIVAIPAKAEPISAAPVENADEAISKIAYGYFVARGYREGNQADDWFRAEREYYNC